MQTVKVTYCGVEGEGRTVTEAKSDAANQISALVRDMRNHNPTVIACNGHAKLVYRGPGSWQAMFLTDEAGRITSTDRGTESGYATRDDAIRAAANHVADLAWSHDVTDDMAFAREALRPYMHAIRDQERAAREMAERWAWQRRYKAARDAGHSDNAARHIAGGLGHLVESGKVS